MGYVKEAYDILEDKLSNKKMNEFEDIMKCVAETHTELIKYKELKWYQKIFAKILKLF